MKKILFLLAVCLLTYGGAVGQQSSPTPPVDDEAVVKVDTNLIQLDVTVTDNKGKVVTGLTADDFEIIDNGARQKVANMSFVSRMSGGATVAEPDGPITAAAKAGVTTPLTPGQVSHTIAIVVDDLNLSFQSVHNARKALKEFVETQMQPNDLVAIIRTGGGMGTLQQFTTDKRLLLAAIAKIRWNAATGGMDSLTPIAQNDLDISERFTRESTLVAGGSSKTQTLILPGDCATERKAQDYKVTRNSDSQENGIYAQTSLGAVRYVIKGMTPLPGRKTMMLFSDGFAIWDISTKSRSSSVYEYLQKVADDANRSSVVVYTFDTKGMRSMSIGASDSTYEIIDGHRGQKERERLGDFRSSQDGLVYLAEQTGGKALLNTDNFNGGLQRALDEQRGYYLLAYMPESDSFDPKTYKFDKIEVKVRRPGLKVIYRNSFFSSTRDKAAETGLSLRQEMADALASPFARSDIAVNVNALYANDPADGAYLRSFLHIDARGLKFTDAKDGWKTATFDVAALVSGDNNYAVESKTAEYTIRTKGPTYEAMLKSGFVYLLTMPVKKPGLYQYRVALRDAGTGLMGSASQVIDIPDLGKQRLTISSLAVEDVSPAVWQSLQQGKTAKSGEQGQVASTLMYDTVLRQFTAGTFLRYGYEIYNLKLDDSSRPQFETQTKIFHDDTPVVEGPRTRLDTRGLQNRKFTRISGAVPLAENLTPGDYVLQVIVTDLVARRQTTQLFPFEIVGK
jgi:VWFA-related protein